MSAPTAAVQAFRPASVPAARHASCGHRHTSHEHEHEFEAAPGLPEPLPAGERMLWQGAPDVAMLARECFHVRKLAVYFAALLVWRVATLAGSDLGAAATSLGIFVALSAAGIGIVSGIAWFAARTTLYTITDRRVVMRIGIVLSVTFNFPFRHVEAAGLHRLPRACGDIALELDSTAHVAYFHLWPHSRPWQVRRPQPSLRCIADAEHVASLLTEAWRTVRAEDAAPPAIHARPVDVYVTDPRPSIAEPLAA